MTTKIHKHQMFDIPIASSAEVLAGTVADKAITPASLTAKIVGTVGYSGGIPTGAIMESGSNANGRWVKWADGTLECYFYEEHASSTLKFLQYAGVIWYCEGQNKIFPHAFYEHSPISVSPGIMQLDTGCLAYATCYNRTSTQAVFCYVDFTDRSNRAYTLSYKAIGRWRA